ncbi:FUSC family protein [Novosphingobium sp. BL-8H]|uniref:FUSC family protein n=1 Tax=Novosphingobium sp. BL-8H TaxID=3127640 RepID=UPI00375724BC
MTFAPVAPNRPRKRRANTTLRWAARRLELRSFGFVPEHFIHAEGLRAAVAVALPLALAVATGHAGMGWAVFAAFWTCLCDAPGPDRLRRRLLAIFVGCGAIIGLAGSWAASAAPNAGFVIGPLLVLAAVLASARIPFGGLLGTLLSVVAVVAVGFPQHLAQAGVQAAAFSLGAIWAYLLINVLWRIDPLLPLERASDAVRVRLLDMADSLVTLGEGQHRDRRWHSEHSEHRRTVRLSIERLRGTIDRYADDPAAAGPFARVRNAAETMFGALIALDQSFIDDLGPTGERVAVARACRTALLAWCLASSERGDRAPAALPWAADRLARLRGTLTAPLFAGCTLALETALATAPKPAQAELSQPLQMPPPAAGRKAVQARAISQAALRQALRQSAGLVAVYYAAILFHLGYPYWAAMAVIVVLQGGARVTWARCLERILGSLLGGFAALGALFLCSGTLALSALAVVLAGTAIALRSVNYTAFVVFLTALFVIVTEMLSPGAGIAGARMLDNVIGSLAALLAVFLLWPDLGASLKERIREGIEANRAYFDAVQADRPVAEVEAVRRSAGLASVEAEVALHDVGSILRRLSLSASGSAPGGASLRDLRTIAGQAAIAWHRRLGTTANSA